MSKEFLFDKMERSEYDGRLKMTQQSPSAARTCLNPIPFDSSLPAATLNIEAKSRANLFPWRGQFSPQLVEALLSAYAPPGAVILDPFMGSGTVLVESARLGLQAHGCEVNPAAYLLARVYELCELPMEERRSLLARAGAMIGDTMPGPLSMPLFRSADRELPRTSRLAEMCQSTPDPQLKVLLEALLVLLDDPARQEHSLLRKWATVRDIVMNLPYSSRPIRASFNDARRMNFPDASVDFVLSSPPYINVFNYHHNSRWGIESLGWKPLVVAKSEIGSNRKFRQNRFLTVIQYCVDMTLALLEIRRVCTDSARLILVVGRESNVNRTPIYNSQLIELLAVEALGFPIHLKQERMFINRFGRRIYEDLLHLTPQAQETPPRNVLIERARKAGKDALIGARQKAPASRRLLLDEAITQASAVEPSPILEPPTANGVFE